MMNDKFEICYLIYKNNEVNQRDIAQILDFALGKVNKLLKELESDEFVIKENGYRLTSKGNYFLESHRVDNAIIMAAGFGSRFVPITYETPKGLLEVHGEVMIERQIKQLHEVGIKDITIIVGYLKEKFEYLTDKFGVKLLYNSEYSVKNNISSIYYAKDILKNSYVLTSDIYMTKNLYRPYEAYSFYAAEYFEGPTEEWSLESNRTGLITKIVETGGSDIWAMYGPAFFKNDFSSRISNLIDGYYNVKACAQWYWEDVLMRHLNELEMFIKKYPDGTILEFESLEELRIYDDSYYSYSKSEILNTIEKVFEVEQKNITDIRTLKEGATNDSFIFTVNKEKYVFRAPGKATEKLINREQEAAVYSALKGSDICDEVVYLNSKNGFKISKYISSARTLDPHNEVEVTQALSLLRQLHNSNIKVDHDFNIFSRIEQYLEYCKQADAILFNDFEEVVGLITEVKNILENIQRPSVLIHVDPVPVNYLLSNDTIKLIDWEYSGMGDPILDLAMFSVYSGYDENTSMALLKNYLVREETLEERIVLFSYMSLSGFLWALWTQLKQADGEDFGTYGIEQYQYARNYAREVKKLIGKIF